MPWLFYPIQRNMDLPFFLSHLDESCLEVYIILFTCVHAGHCFLSMCWHPGPFFPPGICHSVFINIKRNAGCVRFVYVNLCKMSWINTFMTLIWTLFALPEKLIDRLHAHIDGQTESIPMSPLLHYCANVLQMNKWFTYW